MGGKEKRGNAEDNLDGGAKRDAVSGLHWKPGSQQLSNLLP
jgi:hypothetical protein